MACHNHNIKGLLKDALIGGLAGIGVSLTISLATSESLGSPLFWGFGIVFGFIIGIFISVGNILIMSLIGRIIPKKYQLLVIQLALNYIISVAIFYFGLLSIKDIFFKAYNIPTWVNPLSISLGVGVASVMISFFFMYAGEKEEMLRLEKENKELAVVDERNRIARELHDSVSQNLFGISLNLNTLDFMIEKDPQKAREITKLLRGMVEEVQTEMRLMIYELRPVTLSEKGFFEALESMVSLFRVRYNLDIYSDMKGDEALDSRKQLVLYRVLQESLNNIVKHAGTSKVKVALNIRNGAGEMLVQDNGYGFEVTEIDKSEHFGIKGMKERVEQIKGEFTLQSKLGKGTTITVKF
jgi:signal transduction histidine kinase